VSGAVRQAPAGLDLSAYRIIQEALTNVVRHAGTGAVCAVSLTYTDADLIIRVIDDGGLPGLAPPGVTGGGTGHGIIGMSERVHLCGGTFAVGPRPEGGFQVTAALPLPIGTAPSTARATAPEETTTTTAATETPESAEAPETTAAPAAADPARATLASHGWRG
jgi:signal transduction histidine kinase